MYMYIHVYLDQSVADFKALFDKLAISIPSTIQREHPERRDSSLAVDPFRKEGTFPP